MSDSPISAMPQPVGVSLKPGAFEGQIDARCTNVKGAKSYLWETSASSDPNAGQWEFSKSGTKASVTLEGLPSGALIWVRVSAVGSDDTGPHSAPMSVRVA